MQAVAAPSIPTSERSAVEENSSRRFDDGVQKGDSAWRSRSQRRPEALAPRRHLQRHVPRFADLLQPEGHPVTDFGLVVSNSALRYGPQAPGYVGCSSGCLDRLDAVPKLCGRSTVSGRPVGLPGCQVFSPRPRTSSSARGEGRSVTASIRVLALQRGGENVISHGIDGWRRCEKRFGRVRSRSPVSPLLDFHELPALDPKSQLRSMTRRRSTRAMGGPPRASKSPISRF